MPVIFVILTLSDRGDLLTPLPVAVLPVPLGEVAEAVAGVIVEPMVGFACFWLVRTVAVAAGEANMPTGCAPCCFVLVTR